jgi:hypothetical protein
MMTSQRVPFVDTALAPEAPGISSRAIDLNDVRWAIVEYQPDVLREEWCNEGHSEYVLAGGSSTNFSGPTADPWSSSRATGSRLTRAALTAGAPAAPELG